MREDRLSRMEKSHAQRQFGFLSRCCLKVSRTSSMYALRAAPALSMIRLQAASSVQIHEGLSTMSLNVSPSASIATAQRRRVRKCWVFGAGSGGTLTDWYRVHACDPGPSMINCYDLIFVRQFSMYSDSIQQPTFFGNDEPILCLLLSTRVWGMKHIKVSGCRYKLV